MRGCSLELTIDTGAATGVPSGGGWWAVGDVAGGEVVELRKWWQVGMQLMVGMGGRLGCRLGHIHCSSCTAPSGSERKRPQCLSRALSKAAVR